MFRMGRLLKESITDSLKINFAKYLKTMYYCHKCADTLDKGDIDGDGKLTVLDIDFILE